MPSDEMRAESGGALDPMSPPSLTQGERRGQLEQGEESLEAMELSIAPSMRGELRENASLTPCVDQRRALLNRALNELW